MSLAETRKITITNQNGYTLKKPVIVEIPKPKTKLEEEIQNYIIHAFTGKCPDLINFCFKNKSTFRIANHYFLHCSSSEATLNNSIYSVHDFSNWMQKAPDLILDECLDSNGVKNKAAAAKIERLLDSYLGYLIAQRKLAPYTSRKMIGQVKYFFKANFLNLKIPCQMRKWHLYEDRSPSQEELQKVLYFADLREKVIVSTLATGGFRVGTLARLQYRHVKHDLERNIVPIHIHVEGNLTKTKYHDYDTFLNFETASFLKAYLESRRKGIHINCHNPLPSECITDDSPLVCHYKRLAPLTPEQISDIVHTLYLKAGIIKAKMPTPTGSRTIRYDLRAHSIRKFFRSQLAFLGLYPEFIEYMIGHKTSSYLDVKVKGLEYLRMIYAKSGLSINPQSKEDKINSLIAITKSMGLCQEDIRSNINLF